MMRYVIGFLITIGLIILLIVLIFGGGSTKKLPLGGKSLPSYASTEAQTRLTIDGPINAEQTHRQVQITVSRNSAAMNIVQGYNGNVINSVNYANTEAGYSAFLHALNLVGFTLGVTSNKNLASEEGHCPLGQRYIFELIENGQDLQRFWATSCNGPHTYNGNVQMTLTLFQQQIPDYQTIAPTAGF